MSIGSVIDGWFKSAESDVEQVSTSSFASAPTWILVILAGMLIWLTHGVLTEDNIKLVAEVAKIVIIGHLALQALALTYNFILKHQAQGLPGDPAAPTVTTTTGTVSPKSP